MEIGTFPVVVQEPRLGWFAAVVNRNSGDKVRPDYLCGAEPRHQ